MFYYWTHSLFGLDLHERSDWRGKAPDSHHGGSLIHHCCAYTASLYRLHYLVHNYIWQQTSHSLWLYHTPKDGFTVNNASFYKNKVLCHDLQAATVRRINISKCCSVFSVAESAPSTRSEKTFDKNLLKVRMDLHVKGTETRQEWKHKKTTLLQKNLAKQRL